MAQEEVSTFGLSVATVMVVLRGSVTVFAEKLITMVAEPDPLSWLRVKLGLEELAVQSTALSACAVLHTQAEVYTDAPPCRNVMM